MSQFVSHMLQPIASAVSFGLNLQSESQWSLFSRAWQKRPRERDQRLRFQTEEMSLQMQWAVLKNSVNLNHLMGWLRRVGSLKS